MNIMINNLFKLSQVLAARNLSITFSIKIKFHTTTLVLCKNFIVCREVIRLTAHSQLFIKAGGNIQQCRGSSCVAPFFLSRAGQLLVYFLPNFLSSSSCAKSYMIIYSTKSIDVFNFDMLSSKKC